MISANQYNLNWSHFDQIHANRKEEFEKLCRSLFKKEYCYNEVVLHSDHNHPGIEVSPALAKDGQTRISFQAKHFDNAISYDQIKKSMKVVAEKYTGVLDVIYLYCNKDITESCESYRDIIALLNGSGIKLELVTGNAILDQAMSYPPVLSRYFGLDSLNEKWFQDNIRISTHDLGRRYNALFNIKTEAQKYISIFLGEIEGIQEVNNRKVLLLDELKRLKRTCGREVANEISALIDWVKALEEVDEKSIRDSLCWESNFRRECQDIFTKIKNHFDVIQEELKRTSYNGQNYHEINSKCNDIERILGISSYLEMGTEEREVITCKTVIITGGMGTGKSQLLATTAKRMVDNGRQALLILGQMFLSDDSIDAQIMKNLHGINPGQSFESLVAIMDEHASLQGLDSVIFIDAINESRNKEIWKNGINRIISTIEQYNHVKLVVSLRSGFEKLTLSQNVLEKLASKQIASIEHKGLIDNSPCKVYEFLSRNGIPFAPEYYLHEEMTNPLFLTWFCETYDGKEQGLMRLIDNVLQLADQEGSKASGLSEASGMLKNLIYEILELSEKEGVTKYSLFGLGSWNRYGVIDKTSYLNAIERSGVLASFVRNNEECYYIGYNLLEVYMMASKIFESYDNTQEMVDYCRGSLLEINDEGDIGKSQNISIFVMVASLYSITHDEELIDLLGYIRDGWKKRILIEEYYSSFIWRSSHVTLRGFLEFTKRYPVEISRVWEVFIENSVKTNSELNALGLTKLLQGFDMNLRDYRWTITINNYGEDERIISLAHYIESGNKLEGMDENAAYLLSITFTWMLSSSNRVLRDRISKAMIEILRRRLSLCTKLLRDFRNVNDPYIIQRLYGVVFGAVMKRELKDKEDFKSLTSWVYTEIFDREYVYPDILLRDYARLIIERYAFEFPDDIDGISLNRIKPPYNSKPIPVVEEVDYSSDEYRDSGLWPLLHSIKFNWNVKGIGLYGDFGRYVFQSALDQFLNVDISNVYYYSLQYILKELNYKSEWFAEYDRSKGWKFSNNVNKIERIGKKYQWIAMYNILARLTDTFNLENWKDSIGENFEGPWDPYVRDFDPTLNSKVHDQAEVPSFANIEYCQDSFCSVNASDNEIEEWIVGDDIMFKNFAQRLIRKDDVGNEWVSLYIYQENNLNIEHDEQFIRGFPCGEQHIWSVATSYIITEWKQEDSFDELVGQIRDCSPDGIRRCYSLFSREYAWSPGYYSEFVNRKDNDDNENINVVPAGIKVVWEEEYDASQEETTSYAIPTGLIIKEMQLYEKQMSGIFYRNEEVVAFDLATVGSEQTELVIRRDVLDEFIAKSRVKIVWKMTGEKQYYKGEYNQKWKTRVGSFVYNDDGVYGEIDIVDDK